jgi:hypothetical protein
MYCCFLYRNTEEAEPCLGIEKIIDGYSEISALLSSSSLSKCYKATNVVTKYSVTLKVHKMNSIWEIYINNKLESHLGDSLSVS